MTRQFNGHEASFLIKGFVVHREPLRGLDGGYEQERVVVKHPDGKFYRFIHRFSSEHGIDPWEEHPDALVEAVEVVAKTISKVVYVPKEDPP